jgi:hypothetical protein
MLYGFWALAVCSRALWQYASRSGNLLPSHISLLAGVIYLVIFWAALRRQHTLLRSGLICEIIGVVAVSLYELVAPLPYATAWSHFGAGYLYIPLLLPLAGLWSLRASTRST